MSESPQLSVVVPVFNEQDNVAPLVGEIVAALRGLPRFEIVYVDDHSRDDTPVVLQRLKAEVPELRVLRHVTQSGQSTAIRNGVKAARGAWIATLDGDGQNDPADIPAMTTPASQAARIAPNRFPLPGSFAVSLSLVPGNGAGARPDQM